MLEFRILFTAFFRLVSNRKTELMSHFSPYINITSGLTTTEVIYEFAGAVAERRCSYFVAALPSATGATAIWECIGATTGKVATNIEGVIRGFIALLVGKGDAGSDANGGSRKEDQTRGFVAVFSTADRRVLPTWNLIEAH